jgi:hypothetical protein
MLNDRERSALEQWYGRDAVLTEARRLYDTKADEALEEHLHMLCLLPLAHHDELPDYMKADNGETLFPSNLNPKADLEKWRDAVEVAWEVMEREFGFTRDEINQRVAKNQKDDWQAFMDSVERRKKERAGNGDG